MTSLLHVENLNVHLGRQNELHAVRNVSLDVAAGETVCIVGESGCGKSITSLALMGLLPAQARRTVERLELVGEDIAHTSEAQMSALRGRRMSMIFQDPMTSLNPSFTIGDQLMSAYMRHFGHNRAAARRRALELLERTGVPGPEERLRQYPHQLSGGLRQRVMIAMALLCSPQLIIADEPTTALDVTLQVQILKLLKQLQGELELGILLITHDMGVVARTADRVMVMYSGEIVESGRTADVFGNARHPYTRGLLASILRPGSGQRGERLSIIPGTVPGLAQTLTGCAFQNRCAHALPACSSGPIAFTQHAPERGWRCINPQGAPEPAPHG